MNPEYQDDLRIQRQDVSFSDFLHGSPFEWVPDDNVYRAVNGSCTLSAGMMQAMYKAWRKGQTDWFIPAQYLHIQDYESGEFTRHPGEEDLLMGLGYEHFWGGLWVEYEVDDES